MTNLNNEPQNKRENRQIETNQDAPEILTNIIYTPAFLRSQIGKLMKVEFLIGTNNIVAKTGILDDVGTNYILLRSFENNSLIYCELCSIKFITISTNSAYGNMNNNRYYY